jgi:putative OPT family oligopeptide transporter
MSDVTVKPDEFSGVVGTATAEPSTTFKPYIPASVNMRELTALPLITGTILGVIFGASSLYLVLKVGLTVSASIPVAVISITIFRLLHKFGLKDATILENNIVQTAGSAGESIAFGVGATMPAIMILGFDLEITRVILVAVLGGLLGILMMIPLRRALIVKQHSTLKYPEGTACAEVLKAGASAESRAASSDEAKAEYDKSNEGKSQVEGGLGARTIFTGFGIGVVYQTAMQAFKLWKDTPERVFGAPFAAGSVSAEISAALLGVGYIIGPRIASIMCGGGVLAYLVLIPAIKFFGGAATGPVPPGEIPISAMEPDQIRSAYILYIGAGAVAAGGIISLFRSLPVIWHGLKEGLQDLRGSKAETAAVARTDRDLPMSVVGLGVVFLVAAILGFHSALRMNILGAFMIIAFGFLFVTVSSRLTGEIGSSSNPISGMTVATLLLTCLIFLVIGWTGQSYYVTALSVGAIVCIASSNGGTTSQDLKTGYLVGSTPKLQQIAILVGALVSAIALGPILLALNNNATVYVPRITFSKLTEPASVTPDVTAKLLAYTGSANPPGGASYRLLDNQAGSLPGLPSGLGTGQYLVGESGSVDYKVEENFPADLRADPSQLTGKEKIIGVQAETDSTEYDVWQKTDGHGGPAVRYLVNGQGVPVYLVDPGINGSHAFRPDGSKVDKFNAPKAVLMSYIIRGILNRRLPWGLVLLGVMIALVLEMSGIPSLAFAVGVYLPLSSTSPILIGGVIRWLVDKNLRKRLAGKHLTEDQLNAEGDKSPGVLMASGYIAGGALASIIIAFVGGPLKDKGDRFVEWAIAHIPGFGFLLARDQIIFHGRFEDATALIPFAVLVTLLYLAGREIILAGRRSRLGT